MLTTDIHRQVQAAVELVSLRDRIRRVSLLGSRARGTADAGSDIDLLVEFASPVSLFDLASWTLSDCLSKNGILFHGWILCIVAPL